MASSSREGYSRAARQPPPPPLPQQQLTRLPPDAAMEQRMSQLSLLWSQGFQRLERLAAMHEASARPYC